jgi:hypothetical protein
LAVPVAGIYQTLEELTGHAERELKILESPTGRTAPHPEPAGPVAQPML